MWSLDVVYLTCGGFKAVHHTTKRSHQYGYGFLPYLFHTLAIHPVYGHIIQPASLILGQKLQESIKSIILSTIR
jgi:hypothetical protein